MSGQWEFAELLQPLAGDAPCGENLEDSLLLASFDAYRLFGQTASLDPTPDWREIESKSRSALDQSKDLRLLAHFAAAILRTKGLGAFFGVINVAAQWLDEYWSGVYPLVDEDAILRKNALNSFADRIAVVDGVRRTPIVRHSQLGAFSLRDIELAKGQLTPTESDGEPRDGAQVHAAFASTTVAELTQLQAAVAGAIQSLQRIEKKMREEGGSEAAPTFDPLQTQLVHLQRVLKEELAQHPEGSGQSEEESASGSSDQSTATPARASAPGVIASRQDAIRALDAVAAFFRQHEPSSPIPLFIERAKRLVSKDFLEVLADVAPDAVSQARAAGGLRDE